MLGLLSNMNFVRAGYIQQAAGAYRWRAFGEPKLLGGGCQRKSFHDLCHEWLALISPFARLRHGAIVRFDGVKYFGFEFIWPWPERAPGTASIHLCQEFQL